MVAINADQSSNCSAGRNHWQSCPFPYVPNGRDTVSLSGVGIGIAVAVGTSFRTTTPDHYPGPLPRTTTPDRSPMAAINADRYKNCVATRQSRLPRYPAWQHGNALNTLVKCNHPRHR